MTVIKQEDLIESVAAALQYISYYHPADYIEHLARAYEAEQSPAAKDAIAQILTNSRMCAEGKRPICQDTGIVNVFLKIGMNVKFEGFDAGVADAVNEGVRRGYMNPDNLLRGSVLELIIAVPCHVIVRRRDDCCAPVGTFWGIATGIALMLLCFGPGVFYLFAERARRLKPKDGQPARIVVDLVKTTKETFDSTLAADTDTDTAFRTQADAYLTAITSNIALTVLG